MNMTRDTNTTYQSILAYHTLVMRYGLKMSTASDRSIHEVFVSEGTTTFNAILKVLDISDGELRIPCFTQEEAATHAWRCDNECL